MKGKDVPPPPIPADATPEQKKKLQAIMDNYDTDVLQPPPPSPKSNLEYMKEIFNYLITCKSSELESYLEKSKNLIAKLKPLD